MFDNKKLKNQDKKKIIKYMNQMTTLKTALTHLFTRQTLVQAVYLIANVSEALKKS